MITKACGKDIKEKHDTIKLVFLKRFLFCFGNWFDKNKHLISAFTVKVIHGMIPCQTVKGLYRKQPRRNESAFLTGKCGMCPCFIQPLFLCGTKVWPTAVQTQAVLMQVI